MEEQIDQQEDQPVEVKQKSNWLVILLVLFLHDISVIVCFNLP